MDRDGDGRPVVAAAPNRDGQTSVVNREHDDRPTVVAAPDQIIVVDRDDRDPGEEIEVVRTRSFSVGQLLTLLIGAALVVLGVFALIETGIDTPLDEPIEQVMGYDHTPLLGIIEVGAGALLILFALRPGGRWFVAVLGLALVLGGLLVLAEIDWTVEQAGRREQLRVDSDRRRTGRPTVLAADTAPAPTHDGRAHPTRHLTPVAPQCSARVRARDVSRDLNRCRLLLGRQPESDQPGSCLARSRQRSPIRVACCVQIVDRRAPPMIGRRRAERWCPSSGSSWPMTGAQGGMNQEEIDHDVDVGLSTGCRRRNRP